MQDGIFYSHLSQPLYQHALGHGHPAVFLLSRNEHAKFICYTCGTNGTNGTNIHASWAIGPGSAQKTTAPGMTGDRYGLDLEIVI